MTIGMSPATKTTKAGKRGGAKSAPAKTKAKAKQPAKRAKPASAGKPASAAKRAATGKSATGKSAMGKSATTPKRRATKKPAAAKKTGALARLGASLGGLLTRITGGNKPAKIKKPAPVAEAETIHIVSADIVATQAIPPPPPGRSDD